MSTEKPDLSRFIRDIPDWPKAGILFRDITPLLDDPQALRAAVDAMCAPYKGTGVAHVAAVEARGFIFGTAVAARLNAGFVPIRKKGKLPFETESVTYDLEYGTDTIEIHRDGVPAGAKVLLVDDLLATGGTMKAAWELVEKVGGDVLGITCLIELTDLRGRERLSSYDIHTVISY
ncbi:MAG: adenine phosphoribosyltransferase [Planctomycetota bacterium]|jgi:adenine phosphoribosyltransferase